MTGTLFILLATFFWALDTLIRYPLLEAGLSPVQIVFTEHLILLALTCSWLLIKRQSLWVFSKKDWPALLVIGGLGSAVGTLAFTEAFSYMSPTLVILLQKLQPLVAISLAVVVLKERLHPSFVICALLAMLGSFMLMFDDLRSLLNAEGWHYNEAVIARITGYVLTLVAVISWGASTVFGKKLSLKGFSSMQLMHGRFAIGFVFLLPFLAYNAPFEQAVSLTLGSKILMMVLISGLLGMLFYYQGLKRVASRHSALAEMGFPIMAGLINWVVLGFALTPLQIGGAVLLIAASFAVHGLQEKSGEVEQAKPENALG